MINEEEQNYLDLLNKIITKGVEKDDRTGTGVFSLFGEKLDFDLSDGKVPLFTTKKMATKSVIWELIFFIIGKTDTTWLSDRNVHIWRKNTTREALDKLGLKHLKEADMGKLYPHQWRHWGKTDTNSGIDQLAEIVRLIKEDPNSRRIVMCSWNTSDLKEMSLSPCHPLVQFYVYKDELSCLFTSRSGDAFLGIPFNCFSYGLLTHLIAKICGLKAKKLVVQMGDIHVYKNHINQVKEQISRQPYEFPTIDILKNIKDISDLEILTPDDFKINNYKYHPSIKGEMAI